MKKCIFTYVILCGIYISEHAGLSTNKNPFKSVTSIINPKTSKMLEMTNSFNQKTLKFTLNVSSIKAQNGARWSIEHYDEIRLITERIEIIESRPTKTNPNSREFLFKIPVERFAKTRRDPICIVLISRQTTVHWFGTYLKLKGNHSWPFNFINSPDSPISGPWTTDKRLLLAETMFLSSDGFAVLLDELHPWNLEYTTFSSMNQYSTLLCLSLIKSTPYPSDLKLDHAEQYYSMKFRILMAPNLKAVYQSALQKRHIQRPSRLPPKNAFNQDPIWFTSAFDPTSSQYTDLFTNQKSTIASLYESEKILNFKSSKLFVCQDLLQKLPIHKEISDFLQSYHKDGHQILLYDYLPPLVDQNFNQNAKELVALDSQRKDPQDKLLIKSSNKSGTWILDFSKPEAVDWYIKKLSSTRKSLGLVDGILQTGGLVSSFLVDITPKQRIFPVGNELIRKYPNFITTRFVESFPRYLGGLDGNSFLHITDSVYKTQMLSSFVRLRVNGDFQTFGPLSLINDLIAGVLTLSLSGYQLVVGDLQNFILSKDDGFASPNEGTLVRWIEATCYLPGWTIFSSSHWWTHITNQNLSASIAATKTCVHARTNRFIPIFQEYAKRWIENGEPIVRPMWYADSEDPELLEINNQFMLGDNLVAAPLVLKNNSRSVYLPVGSWIREYQILVDGVLKNVTEEFQGKKSHSINNINGLLYFTRKL